MIQWKNASRDDLKRLVAIKILCGSHPGLVNFLFDSVKPRLSDTPENIKEKMGHLSRGEKTLLLIAMDIWGTYGGIHFDDLYTHLSPKSFHNCIKALAHIQNPQS